MADAPSGATGPDQSPVKPKSGALAFFSTATGRIVLAAIGLIVIIIVVGAIAFFFLSNGTEPQQAPQVSGGGGATSTTTTQAVVPTSPPETPLDETFTFRNIFAPSVSMPSSDTASSTDGSGSSETPGTGSGARDTLVLISITSDSGEDFATFTWNGQEYDAKEGEQVDSSPWEVITIDSDSVLMLYGDTKITLTVGQGFRGDGTVK